MFFQEFDELVDFVSSLPGITKRQAKKIINFFLEKEKNEIKKGFSNFLSLLLKINKCKICLLYTTNEICEICSSNNREKKLMIVESISQIEKFEDWKIYNGKYFTIPILFNNKSFNSNINFNFDFLNQYVNNFDEIIIAISPTAEGILTSNFIFDKIKNENKKVKISKLAIGIPIGTSVEYIDQNTMSYAIKNRKDIKD